MHRTENLFNNAGMNAYASNLLSFGMIGITALLCCVLGSCLASLMVLGLEKKWFFQVLHFENRYAYKEDTHQKTSV